VNYFLHSNSFFNAFHFYRFFNKKKTLKVFFLLEENGVYPSYYFVQQNFFLDEMD